MFAQTIDSEGIQDQVSLYESWPWQQALNQDYQLVLPTLDANHDSKLESQRDISVQLTRISNQLRDNSTNADYQLIAQLISEMNSRLYSKMNLLEDGKFHFLRNEFSSIQNSTSTHENVQDKKIVVIIPENLQSSVKA